MGPAVWVTKYAEGAAEPNGLPVAHVTARGGSLARMVGTAGDEGFGGRVGSSLVYGFSRTGVSALHFWRRWLEEICLLC